MKHASDLIRFFCRSAVESKRQKRANNFGEEEDVDILNVAMKSGAFSDANLVDQMMTFLAAGTIPYVPWRISIQIVPSVLPLTHMISRSSEGQGDPLGHETTASALTWALYLLAKHPHIQVRLRNELQQSLPHPLEDPLDTAVSAEIEKLSYLNAVCQETLRLYPPVATTIRVAIRDTKICGQPIPRNTTVMLSPWAVNGSIDLWGPDAENFVPERWQRQRSITDTATENMGTNYNFLTFLHGPRSCIGQGFALGELKCLVAAWVRAFETELQDPHFVPVIKGGITVKPKGGLRVRVKPIEGSVRKHDTGMIG